MKTWLASLLISTCAASSLAADLWLGVGYGGRRMISTDGKTWEITAEWTQPGGDDSNNLISAVWAKNQFVVVGGGGGGPTAGGHILVSQDGRAWKEVLTTKARISPVVFGADRFIAGTSSYPSGKLIWSSDGEKWNDGAKIAAKGYTHFRGGAFGNGVFVFTGNGGGNGGVSWAIVSPDGEKITSERNALPGQGRIVFGGDHFVMMTSHGSSGLIRSKDGIAWEPIALPGDAKVSWLVNAGPTLHAGDNKTTYSSSDATQWKASAMSPKGNVVWSDGQRFIGSSWPGKMSFSKDGRVWEAANEMTANGINRVVKAETPGK
ncbi:hypothetical protein AYO49_04095 [Verrucomicrobiaceae bacterium SCGC AG-212-N21]|nr:hypothetical protein AYO49_04095 [Verrucomicrobiaceae bacterium SCGC AG-212-N21]